MLIVILTKLYYERCDNVKILMVSTISNTINTFLIPHIKMLVENGNKVDVAFNIEQDVNPELKELGCKIYEFPFNRLVHKNRFLELIKQVRVLIQTEKYDLVHTHTPIASAIIRLACKNLPHTKVLYTAHGFHFYDGAPMKNWVIYYSTEKILSRYTDVLITINEEDYNRAKKFQAKRVECVPGVGVNTSIKKMSVSEKKILKKDLGINSNNVFVSVGELNNNKNHKIVIEALATIKKLDFQYLIIGSGPNKLLLENMINEFGLQKKIKLLGFRNDVNSILQVSDAFIFPSFREGLSKALMEAMTLGLPAIVSNIRGNTDLIDHNKGGFLFPPNDSFLLSQQLTKLINEPSIRKNFSLYNVEKIQQFSTEKVLERMKEIYLSSDI